MKKRIRFRLSWYDNKIERPYKIVDEEAIKEMLEIFRKYGKVDSVMHYINYETLRMAYHSKTLVYNEDGNIDKTMRRIATGIDKITREQYGRNLHRNINDLIDRLRNNNYEMKTVLRTYIPKESKLVNGELVERYRPLSILSTEDGILQTTMVNQILEPLTEEIFTEESYGYRPNKNVKAAIEYIEEINYLYDIKYGLVLDNKEYFDSINQEYLLQMIGDKIKDKRFLKIIKIILGTEYLDTKDNGIKKPNKGIFQGINIAPVLANLYLHYVIDIWYHTIDTKDKVFMVRFADDVIFLTRNKEDIETVKKAVETRFKQYDLVTEPDKTKEIDLKEEDLNYLGYRIHKNNREISKYISEKKIKNIKKSIEEIIKDSIEDIKDKCISNRITNRKLYIIYYSNYIRRINNKLVGIYRTYKDIDNTLVLDQLYDYACNEIRKQWSNRLSKTEIDFMISHIIRISI